MVVFFFSQCKDLLALFVTLSGMCCVTEAGFTAHTPGAEGRGVPALPEPKQGFNFSKGEPSFLWVPYPEGRQSRSSRFLETNTLLVALLRGGIKPKPVGRVRAVITHSPAWRIRPTVVKSPVKIDSIIQYHGPVLNKRGSLARNLLPTCWCVQKKTAGVPRL